MRILVLNSGSSSVKFRMLDVDHEASTREIRPDRALIGGAVKGIGNTASFELEVKGKPRTKTTRVISNHQQAIRWLFEQLEQLDSANNRPASLAGVEAVGHRVVHGGERFSQPVLITDSVMVEIDALGELAPLHNPTCLEGIRGVRAILGPAGPDGGGVRHGLPSHHALSCQSVRAALWLSQSPSYSSIRVPRHRACLPRWKLFRENGKAFGAIPTYHRATREWMFHICC